MPTEHHVWIVDDDESIRWVLEKALTQTGNRISSFDSADKANAKLETEVPDVIISDIRMPGMSGLELQNRLKDSDSMLPIIFITGHGDVPMAVEAMRQGALDFIRKPIIEQDLLDRIQQAFDQESGIRNQRQYLDENNHRIASLTKREHQIFERVCEGQVNKSIAIDFGISERTVEVHRSQVMKKLGAKNLAQLVRIHINLYGSPT